MNDSMVPTAYYTEDHKIVLSFNEDSIYEVLAVLAKGIQAQKLQLSYNYEREQTNLCQIIELQITTGQQAYDALDSLISDCTEED